MATIAVTGGASGIGAATADRLRAAGDRVITVDLHGADIRADLGTEEGRAAAIDGITAATGTLDGLVTCAGLAGLSTRDGAPLVSVNYFGTVVLLEGLRETLAMADNPAVVALSSNSATCQPNWPAEIADACLDGDEPKARALADQHGSIQTYPATKAAIAWYVRTQAHQQDWAGRGIRLNAVAPGLIDTAMTAEIRQDPVLGDAIAAFPTPRGAPGRPEEVAALIAFLLGTGASLLYGSVVYADAGTDAMLRARDWPSPWQLPTP